VIGHRDRVAASGDFGGAIGSDAAVRRLQIAAFAAAFDGLVLGPMLVVAAASFGVPLSALATSVAAYFLAYGGMQAFWAVASDRRGRVVALRVGLALGGVAAVAAAVAPSIGFLIAARLVGGASLAAVMPTSMTFVGDLFEPERRHPRLAKLLGAWAAGTAAGTVGAGLAVELTSWRVGLLMSAALAAVGLVALRGLPEPVGVQSGYAVRDAVRSVLSHGHVRVLLVLVAIEGATMLAGVTFLAPALEHAGVSSGLAGTVLALYGAAGVVWAQLVAPLRARVGPIAVLGSGGVMLVAGYGAAALWPSLPGIAATCVLVAGTFGLTHSSLQAWATEVAAHLRATAVALFATCFFVGNAIGTQLGGLLADRERFALLFGIAAALGIPLTAFAVVVRRRALAHLDTASKSAI
jgi:predicted MFS family arabinose efflux permease